tara:strand:- start:1466 stop:2119 length:654 start_codon:yes stop_codon:yes gene_type:complete
MEIVRKSFLILICFFSTINLSYSEILLKEGKNYLKIQNSLEIKTEKIEVLEFFWYNCPHCYKFEPYLLKLKEENKKIDFKRIPVNFNKSFINQQKLFFTLQVMKREDIHKDVFKSIHENRKKLNKYKNILSFIEEKGINKNQFEEIYNSFGIQSQIKRSKQLQNLYNITSVPAVVIGKQYLTSPALVSSTIDTNSDHILNNATINIIKKLIMKNSNK